MGEIAEVLRLEVLFFHPVVCRLLSPSPAGRAAEEVEEESAAGACSADKEDAAIRRNVALRAA